MEAAAVTHAQDISFTMQNATHALFQKPALWSYFSFGVIEAQGKRDRFYCLVTGYGTYHAADVCFSKNATSQQGNLLNEGLKLLISDLNPLLFG